MMRQPAPCQQRAPAVCCCFEGRARHSDRMHRSTQSNQSIKPEQTTAGTSSSDRRRGSARFAHLGSPFARWREPSFGAEPRILWKESEAKSDVIPLRRLPLARLRRDRTDGDDRVEGFSLCWCGDTHVRVARPFFVWHWRSPRASRAPWVAVAAVRHARTKRSRRPGFRQVARQAFVSDACWRCRGPAATCCWRARQLACTSSEAAAALWKNAPAPTHRAPRPCPHAQSTTPTAFPTPQVDRGSRLALESRRRRNNSLLGLAH